MSKTAYSERLRERELHDALLISSDDVRWSFGPEYKPGAERFVWMAIEGFVGGCLFHGRSVILDSTALTRSKRMEFLGWAFPSAARTVCHYLEGSPDLSHKRSSKHIPRSDIDRLWSTFEEPTKEEGWDLLVVIPPTWQER